MTWLRQTKNNVRLIGANSIDELYRWVDAAFAVYDNMRSQTGGHNLIFSWDGTLSIEQTKIEY